MAIRFECGQCGSVLKIKDELAGKPGKCPKCKTAFTVPDPKFDSGEVSLSDEPAASEEKPQPKPRGSTSDDDFDPASFLMEEEPPRSSKRSTDKKPARQRPVADEDDDSGVFKIRRGGDSTSKTTKPSLPLDEDQDEEESDSRKKPRPKPAVASAVAASNVAGDLLSQSAKKGRKTSWNEVVSNNAKQESDFDWQGFREYVGKQVAPLVGGGLVGIFLLFKMASWMMGSGSNLPELGQVTGKVIIVGQPVVGATVIFHPIRTSKEKEDKKKWVSAGSAITNEQGQYDLVYALLPDGTQVKGAPVGRCRIEIDAPARVAVPKKWIGPGSSEFREVTAGHQVHDLDLSP